MKNTNINQSLERFKLKFINFWLKFSAGAKTFFHKAAVFLNRHKIIVSIAAVLILLVSVGFGVANHYLSKINYQEATLALETQASAATIKLYSGEEVNVGGLVKNADGTYTLPDGRIVDEDGSVWSPDGSVIFYDGSYVMADGTAVLSDGTTIYTSTDVVFQDGFCLESTGITVDNKGYATFPDETKLHISAFTLSKEGEIVLKPEEDVVPKYYVQLNSETQKALEDSDKEIEQNIKNNKIWYSDDIINILLLGVDNGSKYYPYGRSDSMILVSVNKKTKKVKLVSLARSAYVSIQGYENTRLSHAHGYGGPALAMDTVERNYRIRVDKYISTNFDSFQKLIDLFGGVEIELTKAEAQAMKSKLKKQGYTEYGAGIYKLNGESALFYARLRKIDTDRQRTQRQRNILTALASQINNMSLVSLNSLLNNILPLITTNLTKVEIVAQLGNVYSYLANGIDQDVLPNKIVPLTLRDGYEVAIVDWAYEVEYAHNLFYSGVTPKYKEE
ncbi:MAG: LCP family protein [Acutalibacteraceae bacterium]